MGSSGAATDVIDCLATPRPPDSNTVALLYLQKDEPVFIKISYLSLTSELGPLYSDLCGDFKIFRLPALSHIFSTKMVVDCYPVEMAVSGAQQYHGEFIPVKG